MKKLLPYIFVSNMIAASVMAHTSAAGGFLSGLKHPVLGPDHLLAMISVGILSAQMGGRALWSVPSAFVGAMIVGGALGMQNLQFPVIELGIALSVVALGVSIAIPKHMPTLLSMLFVAFFGMFHGFAHGLEMPLAAQPVLYATGFVLATAAIHVAGVGIGHFMTKTDRWSEVLRYSGAGIAGIGVAILFGL